MYSQYCVSIGRSRPAACLRSAICSALRRPPWAAVTGSPMTRISRNTIVTSTHSIGMISATRTSM